MGSIATTSVNIPWYT